MSQIDPTAPAETGRKSRPLLWISGLILLALVAGIAGALTAHAAFAGAETAPATWTVATKPTPQPSRTAQAKPSDAAEKTFHFTNCNDAWASGQGAFKRGEPGYTEQLDPDGDGIACPTSPQR